MLSETLPALLDRLDRHTAVLDERSSRLSRIRLALVLSGGLLAIIVGNVVGSGAGWSVALIVLIAFAGLVRIHDRVEAALDRARLWRSLQARHLARIERDWDALGPAPAGPPAGHAYASDLDVTGDRSLLHLLDTTGTVVGHRRLRSWLLGDDPDGRTIRQERVQALVRQRRLRDRLALLGHEAAGSIDERWDDAPIHAWLTAETPPSLRRWAVVLGGLSALTFVLVVVALTGGPSLWAYSFALYAVLYLSMMGSVASVFDKAYDLQKALSQARVLLAFVEAAPAGRDPVLSPVWAPFRGERSPRQRLGRLRRIVDAASIARNDIGGVILNVLLPYNLFLTIALDRLRAQLAELVGPWLDALAEIEALSALAALADRQPDTVFPDLADDGTLLDARDLRHPLLRDPVGNDATLERGEVIIVTGSNMSGKSTFLRALGLASVLSTAGGPVPAASLRIRPLRTVTSMRIGDAVQEGLSTFYAEVRRLRALLDVVDADGAPALVLIDEMLRGTNNRERLTGAQGVVRALVGGEATSLVATHDLLLADLADEDGRIRNAHFRESVEGDQLAFDYQIREGPCPTTNALIIMQKAGLPVDAPAEHA